MRDKIKALSEHFEDHEIEWRVGSTNKDKTKGMLFAYVTNRAIMNRLDDVVGVENWKQTYREIHNGIVCTLSVRFSESGEWISKEDGADLTSIEATKGGLSDAMKRAAVQFGIGRYLYDAETPWVDLKDGKYPVTKPTSVKIKSKPKTWTLEESLRHISQATNSENLTKRYKELSLVMRKDEEVIAKCKEIKEGLEEIIN